MFAYPKSSRKVSGFAVDNNDGKNVMVLANPNESKCQAQFEINGTFWYVELSPDSVSTIIVALS